MTEVEPSNIEHQYDFAGGALCLDFTNTVGDRPKFGKERLNAYRDLLAWGHQAQVLDSGERGRLERLASQQSTEAQGVYERAVELRETLYRIFSAVARGRDPAGGDLDLLNRQFAAVAGYREIFADHGGYTWRWSGPDDALDRMLWPVIQSVADLLTSDELDWVRECDGDPCSWLFVDRSRTHRRRWCDMKVCGNRAKARRHYQKKKRKAG